MTYILEGIDMYVETLKHLSNPTISNDLNCFRMNISVCLYLDTHFKNIFQILGTVLALFSV